MSGGEHSSTELVHIPRLFKSRTSVFQLVDLCVFCGSCMPWRKHGGQRTARGSQFCLFIVGGRASKSGH